MSAYMISNEIKKKKISGSFMTVGGRQHYLVLIANYLTIFTYNTLSNNPHIVSSGQPHLFCPGHYMSCFILRSKSDCSRILKNIRKFSLQDIHVVPILETFIAQKEEG